MKDATDYSQNKWGRYDFIVCGVSAYKINLWSALLSIIEQISVMMYKTLNGMNGKFTVRIDNTNESDWTCWTEWKSNRWRCLMSSKEYNVTEFIFIINVWPFTPRTQPAQKLLLSVNWMKDYWLFWWRDWGSGGMDDRWRLRCIDKLPLRMELYNNIIEPAHLSFSLCFPSFYSMYSPSIVP